MSQYFQVMQKHSLHRKKNKSGWTVKNHGCPYDRTYGIRPPLLVEPRRILTDNRMRCGTQYISNTPEPSTASNLGVHETSNNFLIPSGDRFMSSPTSSGILPMDLMNRDCVSSLVNDPSKCPGCSKN